MLTLRAVLTTTALALLLATTAQAQNPHFVGPVRATLDGF